MISWFTSYRYHIQGLINITNHCFAKFHCCTFIMAQKTFTDIYLYPSTLILVVGFKHLSYMDIDMEVVSPLVRPCP